MIKGGKERVFRSSPNSSKNVGDGCPRELIYLIFHNVGQWKMKMRDIYGCEYESVCVCVK